MTKHYDTEQENFWSGEFGDEYVNRNCGNSAIAVRTAFFAKALARTSGICATLELGANIGLNELALQRIFPDIHMDVVEINKKAADECRKIKNVNVFQGSIFDFSSDKTYDLTFTAGVMIHINSEKLPLVYRCLYEHSRKYVLVYEYYNPTPVEVIYRGNVGKLFKRDFAGEMMDTYPDLYLLDYGFVYHRDPNFPEDDSTWFLMEKR